MKKRKVSKAQLSGFVSIIKNVALIMHVLGIMLVLSIIVPFVFKEYVAIPPLAVMGGGILIFAQTIYRFLPEGRVLNLQDTFITITFGWIVSIFLTGFTFWWIANTFSSEAVVTLQNFVNALFESVSGNTSTGFTMIEHPERLPHVLQWLRTFVEWVGALGLAIFVFSVLHNSWSRFAIHESSMIPTIFQKSMKSTIQIILTFYTVYTILVGVLFVAFGMDVWSAINLSMSCLSTGGFALTSDSIASYSSAIKIIAMIGIICGSLSFTFHYRLFTWKRKDSIKEDGQNVLFLAFLLIISLLLIFMPGRNHSVINTLFQWVSAAGTCGLSAFPSETLSSQAKYFIMFGMLIGGCLGSTAGGIKTRRISNIVKNIWNNICVLNSTDQKPLRKGIKKKPTKKESKVTFKFKGEVFIRLYQSFILFALWMATLLIGWGFLSAFFQIVIRLMSALKQ